MKTTSYNLPDLNISKGSNASEDARKHVKEFLKNCQLEVSGKAIELSVEQREVIARMIHSQVKWMEAVLGISATDRLEALGLEQKIDFFHPEEWEKIKQEFPNTMDLKGINKAPENVILLEVGEGHSTTQALAVLNHEIVHSFSRQVIRIHEDNGRLDISHKLYGFSNASNTTFEYLNEIITESINLESLIYLQEQSDELLLNNIGQCYKRGMILFNMIIDQLASVLGKDAKDVRLDLYRAYYTGDTDILKSFAQVFGRDSLKALASLPIETENSPEALVKFGVENFSLDQTELEQKVRAFDEGDGVEILPGVTWRKNG